MEGQPKLVGFYTTRFVEAETPEKAEDLAVQLIRGDAKLHEAVVNDKSDPPMIYAEEVVLLETFEGNMTPGAGYTFFLYDDETQGKA